jgi:tetratricopeptide (TPR) repeat protein
MINNQQTDLAKLRAKELYAQGSDALQARNYQAAHRLLKEALEKERSPEHLSQYALAVAHYTGNITAAAALCREALKENAKNPELFLRLGTVYLIGGRKKEAIRALTLGLRMGKHAGMSRLLQILGHRRKPVLPFLSRSNPINKMLGKMRARKEAAIR